MPIPAFRPIILFFFLLVVSCHSRAQQPTYPAYDPDAPEMVDIQRTIDDAMDDVEDSLKIKGSFKPFAVVILANDSIAEIHAGKEQKDSFTMQDLEEELSIDALKGNYKVVTIFTLPKAPITCWSPIQKS